MFSKRILNNRKLQEQIKNEKTLENSAICFQISCLKGYLLLLLVMIIYKDFLHKKYSKYIPLNNRNQKIYVEFFPLSRLFINTAVIIAIDAIPSKALRNVDTKLLLIVLIP
jgi:hypothetical protein